MSIVCASGRLMFPVQVPCSQSTSPSAEQRPLLNFEMVPDFGCDLAPCFNTIPAGHARLTCRDENGIFGK